MLVHGPALLQGAGEGAAAEQLARADALELVHERRNLGIDVDVDLVMPLAAGAGLDLDIGEREILVEGDGEEQRHAGEGRAHALVNQALRWLGPL